MPAEFGAMGLRIGMLLLLLVQWLRYRLCPAWLVAAPKKASGLWSEARCFSRNLLNRQLVPAAPRAPAASGAFYKDPDARDAHGDRRVALVVVVVVAVGVA